MYGIEHTETFSYVIHCHSFLELLSLVLNQAWSLHQLDVSNAFLYGDLEEQVFMEQPPRYVAHGKSFQVCYMR